MASYKLLPGDIFNHAYEVNQEIGAGGFAKVYLVKDIRNQDQYALKLLNQDADQDDVKKFIYEANIMGLLEHDHIVKVEGMHTLPSAADPDRYLLMQYAPNGSAEDALNRQAPVGLSVPTTVGYTEQTADALQYLHNRQILHMD